MITVNCDEPGRHWTFNRENGEEIGVLWTILPEHNDDCFQLTGPLRTKDGKLWYEFGDVNDEEMSFMQDFREKMILAKKL
jgi:hypothetical protein